MYLHPITRERLVKLKEALTPEQKELIELKSRLITSNHYEEAGKIKDIQEILSILKEIVETTLLEKEEEDNN